MTVNLNDLLYTLASNDIITLPSGRVATIQEMTGQEQRNFMNPTKLNNGTAIQNLLAACVVSLDGEELPLAQDERIKIVLNLLGVDRRSLIFNIRRHSLGNDFTFSTQCPNCKAKETWEVDLGNRDSFPVTPCPGGDARLYKYESKLRPGLTLRFQLLDGVAEMAILRKRDTMDMLTDLEMRRFHALQEVDGKDIWVPVILNKVPDSLINEMRTTVRKQEGNIHTTVKVICASCTSEVEFDMLMLQDFMIPSATS